MGFAHYVLNLEDAFREHVIEDLVGEYLRGRTPNPCVQCNNWLKFGELMRAAERFDCDYVATGHYARRGFDAEGRATLLQAREGAKDQSYVLWGLKQEVLRKSLFPIGHRSKEEVRAAAREHGLSVADKRESQDICFVEGRSYTALLRHLTLCCVTLTFVAGRAAGLRGEKSGGDGGAGLPRTEPGLRGVAGAAAGDDPAAEHVLGHLLPPAA